jgi:hypothetical protein
MVKIDVWWGALQSSTREWLREHQHERISWHILQELQAADATLQHPDRDRSVYYLSDSDWEYIAAQ